MYSLLDISFWDQGGDGDDDSIHGDDYEDIIPSVHTLV